jgi:hypothetical protein
MKYLKRVGVEGYLCQGSQVWGLYGIDYYAIAQAMWDPGVDIAAELEGFYSGLYGTAAPHMKRFYEKLETALRRHSCINLEDTRMLPAYLTPEVVAEAGKALSEAQAAARPGLEKQRVDMTAQCFDYARHYAAAERARWTCEKSGNLDDLRTAVAAYQALLDVFGGQASPSSLANDKAIKQSTGRLRALQAKLKAAESQQNQEPQGGQTQK